MMGRLSERVMPDSGKSFVRRWYPVAVPSEVPSGGTLRVYWGQYEVLLSRDGNEFTAVDSSTGLTAYPVKIIRGHLYAAFEEGLPAAGIPEAGILKVEV